MKWSLQAGGCSSGALRTGYYDPLTTGSAAQLKKRLGSAYSLRAITEWIKHQSSHQRFAQRHTPKPYYPMSIGGMPTIGSARPSLSGKEAPLYCSSQRERKARECQQGVHDLCSFPYTLWLGGTPIAPRRIVHLVWHHPADVRLTSPPR